MILKPLLLVATLCVLCGPAGAAKPVPVPIPMSPGSVIRVGFDREAAFTCNMGAPGPPVFAVNYILPPNDRFYVGVNCPACLRPDSTSLQDVHVALQFVGACVQPIAISLVGAVGDSTCLAPDTLTVLYPPQAFTLSAPAPGNYDFALHLGRQVRFLSDAFLCVNFISSPPECDDLATRPLLLTEATCSTCHGWNDSVEGREELCGVALPGAPVIYATAGSCATPALPSTWGTLKLRYR